MDYYVLFTGDDRDSFEALTRVDQIDRARVKIFTSKLKAMGFSEGIEEMEGYHIKTVSTTTGIGDHRTLIASKLMLTPCGDG